MDSRIPVHLEVAALIRRVQAEGGFATVLNKGDPEAGTLLVVTMENGRNSRAYERMPQLDGRRGWSCSRIEDIDNPNEFPEYLDRRKYQDADLWIIELDIANAERFIGATPPLA